MSRPRWREDDSLGLIRHRRDPQFRGMDLWELIGLHVGIRKRRQAKRKRAVSKLRAKRKRALGQNAALEE